MLGALKLLAVKDRVIIRTAAVGEAFLYALKIKLALVVVIGIPRKSQKP